MISEDGKLRYSNPAFNSSCPVPDSITQQVPAAGELQDVGALRRRRSVSCPLPTVAVKVSDFKKKPKRGMYDFASTYSTQFKNGESASMLH